MPATAYDWPLIHLEITALTGEKRTFLALQPVLETMSVGDGLGLCDFNDPGVALGVFITGVSATPPLPRWGVALRDHLHVQA